MKKTFQTPEVRIYPIQKESDIICGSGDEPVRVSNAFNLNTEEEEEW